MKKPLFTLLLILTAAVLLCTLGSCKKEISDLPPSIDTTDNTPSDTTADTTADTTKTPDTEPQPPEDKIWEDFGMTEEEWNDFAAEHDYYFPQYIHETVMAMLTGDVDTFAKNLGAPAEVYEYVKDMKFGNYRMYTAEAPAKDDPSQTRRYPTLEIEILESPNSFFKIGTNRLVFIVGVIAPYIEHLESIEWYADSSNFEPRKYSFAETYIVNFLQDAPDEASFESLHTEGVHKFGLADFIIQRLSAMHSYERKKFTADEIRNYAQKYLGVEPSTVKVEDAKLYNDDGKYGTLGRGGRVTSYDFISEQVLDGITVVTVTYYADFSKTIIARTVEYHLKLIDGEYSPVKTVITQDSEYVTANFYV